MAKQKAMDSMKKRRQKKRVKFVFVISLILLFMAFIWLFMNPSVKIMGQSLQSHLIDGTAKLGFRVEKITVTNNKNSDKSRIMNVLNVERGSALFAIDLQEKADDIIKIGWVEDVVIERIWPNHIHIYVVETKPVAQFQKALTANLGETTRYLIDIQGEIIAPSIYPAHHHLPLFIGESANENFIEILELNDVFPQLFEQVSFAEYIGNRRWNLHLIDDLILKLPEANPAMAIEMMLTILNEAKISWHQISQIDIRQKDRVIIKTKDKNATPYLDENLIFEAQ